VRGQSVYLVPRPGGDIVCGATAEELGTDTTVTAGAVYSLLRDAQAVLPILSEAELAETAAGLRPGSPDNAPMIGPSIVDGLAIATGHYRHGILLAPVTAAMIAELLSEGSSSSGSEWARWAAFDPRRFSGEVTQA
jgi:glycine oxidase